MHHFIMGKRQHKVFAVLIHHPKGHFIVMILAINWVKLHIGERIVHPAHIPFKIKSQPTVFTQVGHTSKRGRFLRNRNRPRHFAVNFPVGMF